MSTVESVLKKLQTLANPENVKGMARYGINAHKRMGVAVPDMRKLAKEVGKDHQLALELWRTGIPEAMIVAALVGQPELMTEAQMEDWVKDLNSWDVCDQVCMNLFEKSPLARKKIIDWSEREEEFVKRAAYALLACLAWHDKQASDESFIEMLPVIQRGATDGRNYVKKAVSWALRNIGKRNLKLNAAALETAREIQTMDSKPARWIASQVIRELESEAVQKRLRK
ncbi:MAG: DNA alkylation repair protein [Anaerolineales bacterium]|jgi:3-methyladenine DNA glycosylase AlkD